MQCASALRANTAMQCTLECSVLRTMENRVPVASRKSTYRKVISACDQTQQALQHTA